MSAPPPSDWVDTRDLGLSRDPILDSDPDRATQRVPGVILEGDGRAWPMDTDLGQTSSPYAFTDQQAVTTYQYGIKSGARRRWREMSFSLLRRDQLLAMVGFTVLLLVVLYAVQSGPLSQESGSVLLGGPSDQTPAGPGALSDPGQSEGSRSASRRLQGKQDRSSANYETNAEVISQDTSGSAVDDISPDSPKVFAPKNTSGTKAPTSSEDGGRADDNGLPPFEIDPTEGTLEVAGNSDSGAGDSEAGGDDSGTPNSGSEETVTGVRFESCAEAAAAGATPIPFGAPGYRLILDADNDGLACENGPLPEVVPVEPDDDTTPSTVTPTTATPSTTTTTEATTTTAFTIPGLPISSTTEAEPNTTTSSTFESTTTAAGVSTTSTPTTEPATTTASTTTTTERTTTTTDQVTTTSAASTTSTSPATTASSTETTVATTAETASTETPTTAEPVTTEAPPTTDDPSEGGPG